MSKVSAFRIPESLKTRMERAVSEGKAESMTAITIAALEKYLEEKHD
jgi:predicted DNA-binding protein